MVPVVRWRVGLITPALIEEVVRLTEGGASNGDVCRMLGMPKSTFSEWLKAGRAGKRDSRFRRFALAVDAAEAKLKAALVESVRRGIRTEQHVQEEERFDAQGNRIGTVRKVTQTTVEDPRHHEWLLARKWSREYGRQVIEHEGIPEAAEHKVLPAILVVRPEPEPEENEEAKAPEA